MNTLEQPKAEPNKTIIRLTTSYWSDSSGAYSTKSIKVLKRKSSGYNILLEECSVRDAESAIKNIVNINDVHDGIYELVVCDVSKDYETGIVDDWHLKLVPYEEEV